MSEKQNTLQKLYTLRAGLSYISRLKDKSDELNRKVALLGDELNKLNADTTAHKKQLDFYESEDSTCRGKQSGASETHSTAFTENAIKRKEEELKRYARDAFENYKVYNPDYSRLVEKKTASGGLNDKLSEVLIKRIERDLGISDITEPLRRIAKNGPTEEYPDLLSKTLEKLPSVRSFVDKFKDDENLFIHFDTTGYGYIEVRKAEKELVRLYGILANQKHDIEQCKIKISENTAEAAKCRENIDSCKNGIALFATEAQRLKELLANKNADLLVPEQWENLDIIIYYIYNGYADTVKEALVQKREDDRTNMLLERMQVMETNLVNTINAGFDGMRDVMVKGFTLMSHQLSAIQDQVYANSIETLRLHDSLIDANNNISFSNALLQKANASCAQLVADTNYMCTLASSAEVRRRNGLS